MDLIVDPIVEMEEWLSEDVPCGGNLFPVTMDCPDSAAATLVNWHMVRCDGSPKGLKCQRCYEIWHAAVTTKFLYSDYAACRCGHREPISELYQPL